MRSLSAARDDSNGIFAAALMFAVSATHHASAQSNPTMSNIIPVNADLAHWLGPDALSPGRMQMLMILWAKKGPVLQRDLVDALGVSRASVSELVELLSRDKLVKTSPDAQHGRRVYVELTSHGRELATRQIRENGNRLDAALGKISQEEKRDFIDRLDRICPPRNGLRDPSFTRC